MKRDVETNVADDAPDVQEEDRREDDDDEPAIEAVRRQRGAV